MTQTKTYTPREELGLSSKFAFKLLVELQGMMPELNAKCWLTAEEIRHRLVYCGVKQNLLVEHVIHAIRFNDRGCTLKCRRYCGVHYYRPNIFIGGTPSDRDDTSYFQSLPSAYSFLSDESISDGIKLLNNELNNIGDLEQSIRRNEVICEIVLFLCCVSFHY